MPIKDILQLSKCIDRIKAEDYLVQLNIADYPKMGKENRKNFHKSLVNMSNPEKKLETVSTSEAARKLAQWQQKK